MHEFSIAMGIVDTLQENGYLDGVKIVSEIKLKIGRYAGIDENYLSFAFENLDDKRFKDAKIIYTRDETDEIQIKEIVVD